MRVSDPVTNEVRRGSGKVSGPGPEGGPEGVPNPNHSGSEFLLEVPYRDQVVLDLQSHQGRGCSSSCIITRTVLSIEMID